jgi:DNA/RNA-binding domain of Phe-tRNA-synthetase-like protein
VFQAEFDPMIFSHTDAIWQQFPELAVGTVRVDGIVPDANVEEPIAANLQIARLRLDAALESEFPEIQAWRRAFSRMGLKPTQYRCASEALLRRLRKERDLPRIHPLIDLCNAVSVAYALPIAVFDLANVEGDLTVRHAEGNERYETFGGEIEAPEAGEVVFLDSGGNVHARRWCNRQSGASAVRESTSSVLIVTEAMHEGGTEDVRKVVGVLERAMLRHFGTMPNCSYPTAESREVAV